MAYKKKYDHFPLKQDSLVHKILRNSKNFGDDSIPLMDKRFDYLQILYNKLQDYGTYIPKINNITFYFELEYYDEMYSGTRKKWHNSKEVMRKIWDIMDAGKYYEKDRAFFNSLKVLLDKNNLYQNDDGDWILE